MAEKLHKYILMKDKVWETTGKGWILSTSVPHRLLRGEILEALPEVEQPADGEKIALKVISTPKQNIELECNTLDVVKLTNSEADLLEAISSVEERFRIYRERNRVGEGQALDVGNKVFVKVKNHPKELSGVIWYKGNLPTHNGTMFGVELLGEEAEGCGTSNGTFRGKRYFDCPQDQAVFVAMDKLRPLQDPTKSPKKDVTEKPILSVFWDKFPSISNKDSSSHSKKIPKVHNFKIDQRVVVCQDKKALRGTLRYISETTDKNGDIIAGIELDHREGTGTGMYKGKQRFACKKEFGIFVPVTTVLLEDDFDGSNQTDNTTITDRLTRSDGFHGSSGYQEANSGNSGIKSSKSATSISSASSEEALKIAGGQLQNSNNERFVKQQHSILNSIQAKKKAKEESASDGISEPVAIENSGVNGMQFDEEHFKRSPQANSELPYVAGRSQFYHQSKESSAPCNEETKQESSGLQPPSRSSTQENHYNILPDNSHGMHSSANATSVIDNSHDIPYQFHIEGRVTSSGEVFQHHFTDETQTDVEMREPKNSVQTRAYNEHKILQSELEVGSMVEVPIMQGKSTQYGVIRWIGELPENPGKIVAGLELEKEQAACSDGTFGGRRYFTCLSGRAFFVNLQHCHKDSRFHRESLGASKYPEKAFGSIESPLVRGIVPPPSSLVKGNQGRMKGIQGHHNSCYLDATLFSMFSYTTVFDSLLHRSKHENDLAEYEDVQKVLKEHIVNPLRNVGYVRADNVLQLRRLLDELGSTTGLMNEEKDPEEFLNTLLQQVLKSEPLLKLKTTDNRIEETNYYQIITEKDNTKKSQPVQKLLEQSFLFSDLKLAEVPSCLILQMPRFGKRYKMYDFIQPNLKLDITHILENVPRACSVCGRVSSYECKDCYPEKHELSNLGYCDNCVKTFHNHHQRTGHRPRKIEVPKEYMQCLFERGDIPIEKQTMDLFAVVCIATSHYVAFVKCGTSDDSTWCFFDSMADRKGETNGYNIPVVSPCPEAKEWLSKKDDEIIRASESKELPPEMKRLFGDAYMCLYQNLEMTMYK